jgi:hypothetical protein
MTHGERLCVYAPAGLGIARPYWALSAASELHAQAAINTEVTAMRRFAGGLLSVGALLASAVLASPAAAATAKPTCGSYKVATSHETNDFTDIKLVGVSCTMAHKVLGRWANYGSGGPNLGFACTDQKTSSKYVYAIKCTKGTDVLTARDTFKAH